MRYTKQMQVSGSWVKASELQSGVRAKLVGETNPIESQFDDKNGNPKMQDVSKIRFENRPDTLNVALNRATINGLIDAFGEDSKEWINKYLTVHTEKMIVGGKRVTALYLIPEGFEVAEDENGYMVVKRKSMVGDTGIEYPEHINPDEIPF